MIRTAILAFALVAVPSAALAQSQLVVPEGRTLGTLWAPPSPGDGPPADLNRGMAPEYNGWIYQEVDGGWQQNPSSVTELYRGDGYPATIMVCPAYAPVILLLDGGGQVVPRNNRCATVTTDHLRVATYDRADTTLRIRYRILAVHRAAD
jgi:hypothetical protein